jgi:peptide-methionine (S)-S-oxide reductase
MGLNPEGPATNTPEGAAKATVAAGCFWGVEHMFRKEFKGKGLYDARVGYIGGESSNPSYRAVCSGRTGRKSLSEAPQSISCLSRQYNMNSPTNTTQTQKPSK